jgi:glycosyltransferase involved in cell wall biosynthesis
MNLCLKILFFFCLLFLIIKTFKGNINGIKLLNHNRIIRDVLFINGCDYKSLFHPYRYRVLHQIEQLKAGNLECFELYYSDLNPLIVLDFHIIIFYRCPWTISVNEAIELAKSFNKKVFFDIDDLVIDTKYTNLVPYLKTLSDSQKQLYDENVTNMGKTLKLCEGAITTTKTLAKELKNYVQEVFVNHNVASEEMFKLSQNAIEIKSTIDKKGELLIGYFSGSITHNSDIEIIIPAFIKILQEFENVKICFFGELDIPNELKNFSSRIIKKGYVDWKKLPELISKVDINIAPIEENIFNAAKSENKWVEAALVKVPTVASNFGIFKEVIKHGETGLLCKTQDEWYRELKTLLLNENLRKTIGNNAFEVCKDEYNTLKTGNRLANYIYSFVRMHIGFFLPSLEISGGIRVVLVHSLFLQENGYDVDLIVPESNIDFITFQGHKFNVIGLNKDTIACQYDIIVATLYTTLNPVLNYYKAKRRLYLVQGYETDFYTYGDFLRGEAEKTYNMRFGVEYITISKWCKTWLMEKYNHNSRFAPNGIFLNSFIEHKRNLNKEKVRILIEGDSSSFIKNVDESFKIVEKLDKKKFEIWYISYNGKPKRWYRVDKFFYKVPYEKVSEVYEKCDILIKSSRLESFSFPPLEMMATGGYCIVVPNGGNMEYLKNEQNCLLYKLGDIDAAVESIKRLIDDEQLQKHLYENGLETAKNRDWKNYRNQIIDLYQI